MSKEPRRLKEVLDQGQFAVTIEYNPPKGTNISGVLDNAKQLIGRVHGVNVTDNTAAVVRADNVEEATLLLSKALEERGLEFDGTLTEFKSKGAVVLRDGDC